MCGIAGLIRHRGLAPGDAAAVARVTEAQRHRGPDAADFFADDLAALGHRRLSIIDLSNAGTQPMPNEDRSVWVTYNGEIYNFGELRSELAASGHQFRSQTDTEVLVHGYEHWGIDGLLARLDGMFAFGLYDVRARAMLLARDHVGIKPLYYHVNDAAGLMLFASELKALMKSGCVDDERDRAAVAGFLLTGSVPAPRTMVKGVSALRPGHLLTWKDGRAHTRHYWKPSFEPVSSPSGASTIEHIRMLASQAVAKRLVSDVPIGVFLGGGVDSASVATLAARTMRGTGRLNTLTVTFDEAEFNEGATAAATARQLGAEHREVRVTKDDFSRELPRLFAAMDQPTNDGVNTYFVSRAARQAGLTVVLSGVGGDEVFLGYNHYRRLASLRWLGACPAVVRQVCARTAVAWGEVAGQDRWMRAAFLEGGGSPSNLYLLLRGFFPPAHVSRLTGIAPAALAEVVNEIASARVGGAAEPLEHGFNRIEFSRYLHDQLLRDADVFSMAHSIELRVPLLDRRLIDYVLPIAPELKIQDGTNKPLLVEAVDSPGVLQAARAPKRGFTFPMHRWMRESAGELQEQAERGSLLDAAALRAMWTAFRGGRLHWSRAWGLTVLGALSTGYSSVGDALPVPVPAPALAVGEA